MRPDNGQQLRSVCGLLAVLNSLGFAICLGAALLTALMGQLAYAGAIVLCAVVGYLTALLALKAGVVLADIHWHFCNMETIHNATVQEHRRAARATSNEAATPPGWEEAMMSGAAKPIPKRKVEQIPDDWLK